MADWFDNVDTQHAATTAPASDWFDKQDSDWFDKQDKASSVPPPESTVVRVGRGALRGFGLPDSMQALHELDPKTWFDDVSNAIHDKRYGHAAAAIGEKLLGPSGNLLHTGWDQLQRAHDALKQGRYQDALIHTGVAGLQLATPFAPGVMALPGMANGIDEARQGNVAGGAAQVVTGGIGGPLLGKVANKVGAAITPESAAAKNLGEVATRAQAAKLLNEGYKPDSAQQFNSNMFDYALPLLEEVRPAVKQGDAPLTYEDLPRARAMAMEQNRAQFRAYANRAQSMGLTAPADPIADKMIDAIPRKVKDLYPDQYDELVKSVNDTYRGKNLDSDAMESYNRTNNAVLSSFYDRLSADQNNMLAANATKAMQDAEADATREQWYGLLDKSGNGENARELQRRWGALKSLGDEHEKLNGRLLNQDTTKPAFSATDLLKWFNPKGAAVDVVKKGMQKALNVIDEDPRTSVAKINQALKMYQGGQQLPHVPPPQPWDLAPPEGHIPPIVQRNLFGEHPAGELQPQNFGRDVKPLDNGVNISNQPFTLQNPEGRVPDLTQRDLFYKHEEPANAPRMKGAGPRIPDYRPLDPNDLMELLLRQRQAGRQPVEFVGPKELPPGTIDISKWLNP